MALGRKTGGRAKGTPNRTTAEVKAAFEQAFDGIGGVERFTKWANRNPELFYPLWSKLLPKDLHMSGDVAGRIIIVRPGADAE